MISIAMATYNGSKYLCEQLDSILSQTVQDFELIVCDDCSTDNTMSILREYSSKDERIRIYQNKQNLGFKDNFSKAISLCNGEYIALCDQDDIWLEDHLSLLYTSLLENNAVLACGDAIIIDENGIEKGFTSSYLDGMDMVPQSDFDKARHILLCENTFQGSTMLMRKALTDVLMPIPADVCFHDTWIAAFACFSGGITYVHTPVLKYRRHSLEITNGKRRMSALRKFIGATLVNHSLKDRQTIVDEILSRCKSLNSADIMELQLIRKMLLRRSSIWGRLLNIPYYLKHFSTIYTTNSSH